MATLALLYAAPPETTLPAPPPPAPPSPAGSGLKAIYTAAASDAACEDREGGMGGGGGGALAATPPTRKASSASTRSASEVRFFALALGGWLPPLCGCATTRTFYCPHAHGPAPLRRSSPLAPAPCAPTFGRVLRAAALCDRGME